MAIPTDAEITAAAAELGITGPLRGRERAKVARAIQLAKADTAEDNDERPDFTRQVADTHAELLAAGLPAAAAARVVAALAPALWRDTH